jgi:hypothetical protein
MPTLCHAIPLLVLALAIIPATFSAEARHISVASPDGAFTAAVGLGSDDRLECRLSLDDRELVRLGLLGLVVSFRVFSGKTSCRDLIRVRSRDSR